MTSPRESHPNVRFIRIFWTDLSGTVRCRIVPRDRLKHRNIKFLRDTLLFGPQNDTEMTDIVMTMQTVFEPDLETLHALPFLPGPSAGCFGYLTEKDPRAEPYHIDLCARYALKRAVDFAASRGVEFLVGFEPEFVLCESISPFKAAGRAGGWSTSTKILAGSKTLKTLHDIYDALEAMDIPVNEMLGEGAPGQCEIPLGPLPPLKAVDTWIAFQEAVKNIASLNDLYATFAPLPDPASFGTGVHIHISLTRHPREPMVESDQPVPGGMTARERHFLAGLVAASPALAGVTTCTGASMARMKAGSFAGGSYASWGIEHHEVPLRLCWSQEAGPETRRFDFEYRPHDGTSNPYIALAAIIHAGLLGIERQTPLPPPFGGWIGNLTEKERHAVGLTDPLPMSCAEALDRYEQDRTLVERVGKTLSEAHLKVRRHELQVWESKTPEEQQHFALMVF